MYAQFLKRVFDIILSGLLILILTPVFLIIALLVKIFMGSPILFKQARTGKDDKIFTILKFKTMKNDCDKNGILLPDELRMCKFGKILRSLSLDELPELFNIFVGDMSFIGPRPLLERYIPYYTENEKDRNTVRCGLIPPEVITYNITPSWTQQLESEAYYAKNLSFFMDLKIFFATFVVLFKRVIYGYGDYIRQPLDVERTESREVVNYE